MFFHQKQEMNSSYFFRAHWSRHLCCKALVDRQAHVQPTSPSIYIEGTSSLITLSPSLVDPAMMSVVREVDGQETGLSVQPAEKKNRLQTGQDFIYRAHWPRLLCFYGARVPERVTSGLFGYREFLDRLVVLVI